MFSKYLLAILPLLLVISGKPIEKRQGGVQCPSFPLQDYADFQISSGVAGNAESEANAIFVDPFQGCDLATVDQEILDNMAAMREAAEDAETSLFNPQIDAAQGDLKESLQVGKIKNEVLKLTGFNQVLRIQTARGNDKFDKIAEEQGKLDKNIATDEASAGETSTPAVESAGGANTAAIASSSSDSASGASAVGSASGSTCTCAN